MKLVHSVVSFIPLVLIMACNTIKCTRNESNLDDIFIDLEFSSNDLNLIEKLNQLLINQNILLEAEQIEINSTDLFNSPKAQSYFYPFNKIFRDFKIYFLILSITILILTFCIIVLIIATFLLANQKEKLLTNNLKLSFKQRKKISVLILSIMGTKIP